MADRLRGLSILEVAGQGWLSEACFVPARTPCPCWWSFCLNTGSSAIVFRMKTGLFVPVFSAVLEKYGIVDNHICF